MEAIWTKTITDFDRAHWDTFFDNNILKSFDLLLAVERSNLADIELQYLQIKDNNKLTAIIPCFIFNFKLEILTTKSIKQLIETIRKIFPNLFKVRILCVGTPIAICDHVVGIKANNDNEYEKIFKIVFNEIKKYANKLNISLTLLKEIPSNDHILLKCLKENNILIGQSLPNSYVFLDKRLGNWGDALRARYRQRIKRQIKASKKKSNFHWKVIKDFGQYCDTFKALYHQVLEKSEYKFETLNSNFFKQVSEFLPENSSALVCTDINNKLVCFELILSKEDVLIPIYVGIDYAYLDEGDLYFSCINNLILYAEENGFNKIKFGQTSYLAKAYVGSIFEDLMLGIYSQNVFIHQILKIFNKLLFTAPSMPSVHVYRQEIVNILDQIILENNIIALDYNKPEFPNQQMEENNNMKSVKSAKYGRMASIYNLITEVISMGGNARSQNYFIKFINPEMKILNVGCGSVGFSSELSLQCKHVYSVDISSEMISIAKNIVKNTGDLTNISFICADITQYNPGNSYDIVFANFFLNTFNVNDYPVVLNHIMSLVKKGGLFCIADEITGEKISTRIGQTTVRPLISFFHAVLANHPLHSIYDYSNIILNNGFSLVEKHRDETDFICSWIFKKV